MDVALEVLPDGSAQTIRVEIHREPHTTWCAIDSTMQDASVVGANGDTPSRTEGVYESAIHVINELLVAQKSHQLLKTIGKYAGNDLMNLV